METGSRGGSAGAEGENGLAATFASTIVQLRAMSNTRDGGCPVAPEQVWLHFPPLDGLGSPALLMCVCGWSVCRQ